MSDIDQTLLQRGEVYADFRENAKYAQDLKRAMRQSPNWEGLPDYIKEGFEVIASKISRALSGDPLHLDNFHDIAGYAKLMEDRARQDRVEREAEEVRKDVV